MTRILLIVLILLAGALAGPGQARAWWNSDWTSRMRITADAGPKGAGITQPIGRTQVLLRLHSGNFNFDTASENGEDIRIIAGNGKTPLQFHIERYDGLVDQIALIWVDVPDLAPGTTNSFWLYSGNRSAQPGGDPKSTYDPNQLLVYHFSDENGVPHDTTGYGNNALTAGKRDDGGMIGHGLRLDGSAAVQIPASPSLATAAGDAMTYSMWVRPAEGANNFILYNRRDGANAFTIGVDQGIVYAEVETSAGRTRTSAGSVLTDEQHLIAVTTGDRLQVYVDGAPQGDAPVALPALSSVAYLGGAAPAQPGPPGVAQPAAGATGPANFAGVMDEFRIAKTARPAGSFGLEVASEGPKPTLLTFEQPEQSAVFGNSYFAIIIRSVTTDAWIVIGILGAMAVISWSVMVGKALYLWRIGSANHLFRAKFHEAKREAPAGPEDYGRLSPGGESRLRRSPLFRLYDVGMREVRDRAQAGRFDSAGRLPVQSLTAIKATLDAGLARETQRLNSLMVLLTIAISGGPFLGLLGTVVGVMITFAAIAAAGDVNINAIAPGISAALLATVAGLGVAIPALFGYNYFTVRVREVVTDMQVFIDELISRVGEGIEVDHPPLQRRAAE